jgi:hypothetical protein
MIGKVMPHPILNRHQADNTFCDGRRRSQRRLLHAPEPFENLEERMNITAFSSPVFVKSGAYLVQEIADLEDAVDFLEEWPEDRRSLIHETALRACYQAHGGLKPMSVARDAFVGFAKRAGILEEPEAVMPWIAASNSGGGQVQV